MDNKKVLMISIFAVILLVVIIIIMSYQMLTANLSGSGEGKINTGTVSLKCNEKTFNIKDATPISDAKGIASDNNVASCELVSTMEGEMIVGYDIALTEVDEETPNDNLSANDIKIDVYKSIDNGELIYLAGTSSTKGVFINDLLNNKGKYDKSILGYNIDSVTISGNHKVNYYIKAWVTNDKKVIKTTNEKEVCSNSKYKTEEECKANGEVWGNKKTTSTPDGTFSFKLKIGATQVLNNVN